MHKIQCYRCLAAAWASTNMFYPVILLILNFIVLGSNSKSLLPIKNKYSLFFFNFFYTINCLFKVEID
jgi:hypothetical protein